MMAASVQTEYRRLRQLCHGLADGVPDAAVTGLALDSRQVRRGGVFVALAGTRAHGLDHLDQALHQAPAVVLCEAGDPRRDETVEARCHAAGVPLVSVPSLHRQLGTIAARYFGEPANALDTITAVTGTDGKTSVTHFIAAMLDRPEAPAAVLGTLGRGRVGSLADAGLTTPDAIGVQAALAELVDVGIRHLALEASSHGLAQYRLDGTRIDVAVLTQLGRDHLDYHADESAYAAAKARLFAWPGLTAAVLNLDDPFGRELAEAASDPVQVVGYGRDRGRVQARGITARPDGLAFDLVLDGRSTPVTAPLIGAFNVDNLLAACGALVALGHDLVGIADRVAAVQPVPGRMECFRAEGHAPIVVDYAHNAGSLEAALAALRDHTAGQIWCVFGAGGDRDPGKRPLMAAAAAAGADRAVVTDDNPRHEDPDAIVEDILAGMPQGFPFAVERDRERALAHALEQAGPGDAILLAGKGHEAVQIRGDEALAWSDRDAARRLLGLSPGGGA